MNVIVCTIFLLFEHWEAARSSYFSRAENLQRVRIVIAFETIPFHSRMHKQESSNLMPHDDILGRWRPQKTKQNYRLIVYDMLYECTINHHLSAIHIFPWNEISLKVICYRNSYSKNLYNSSDLLLVLENLLIFLEPCLLPLFNNGSRYRC